MIGPSPRYLVDADASSLPCSFVPTLIVGSGVAGLRAALSARPYGDLLVVTKASIRESNTEYAQGGVAGVLSKADSFESHVNDTLQAGAGLCEPDVVRTVVEEGPARIREILEWGAKFDRVDGDVALTREGGHSHARIAHAGGDATGHEIQNVFIRRIREAKLRVWEHCFLLDLVALNGRCAGAIVLDAKKELRIVFAGATVLASGGACRMYRESTNPPGATGDGMAAAYRAGARLRDMEFIQFHPTVLYLAGAERKLISEAVRGEGAVLLNLSGERFMLDVHPLAELAPRDVVSRAIQEEMGRRRETHVLLDMRMLGRERIERRFPGIWHTCTGFGLDPSSEPIPVRPSAHYTIGGVVVDADGRTSLPGLFACGEVASSGLHGANRLGSNSLLEGLVLGARAGKGAALEARGRELPPRNLADLRAEGPERYHEPLELADMQNSLKALMGRAADVVRNGEALRAAAETVDGWARYVLHRRFDRPLGWELQNMTTLASLLLDAAERRRETRGAHTRGDFPDLDDETFRGHQVYEFGGSEPQFEPVGGATSSSHPALERGGA